MSDSVAIAELRRIPSVGPSLARDLLGLGKRRCVLYTFRCAVYFASTTKPDPEKLKWWQGKDRPAVTLAARKAAALRGLRPAGA